MGITPVRLPDMGSCADDHDDDDDGPYRAENKCCDAIGMFRMPAEYNCSECVDRNRLWTAVSNLKRQMDRRSSAQLTNVLEGYDE